MGNIALFVLAVVVVATIVWYLRFHGTGIVARRGLSIGADLGTMGDRQRVRVQSVTKTGPDRVHVLLLPEASSTDGSGSVAPSDLDFVVSLTDEEFGFQLLNQWQRSASSLAVVIPPGTRLVRLRSIDDLQHLTLSRIAED